MIESLVISLVLTLIIELEASHLLGIRGKNNIKVVLCANTITNPIVVYVSNIAALFGNERAYVLAVIVLELFALIVEFSIYKKHLNFSRISPFFTSAINNVASFGIGLILNM